MRALAVLAVLIFHIWPGLLPGGFIGVDVFFAVSGFLITTLLLREWSQHGRIDFARFWVRRARRLIPALVLVVLASTALALLGHPDLRVGLGRQVLGALTFSANWIEIAHGASYFNATSPVLFMNFWSLAVEEQFYLMWPLLLWLVLMFVPNRLIRIGLAGGGALLSTLLMAALYTPGQDATRVYYGADTHSFGLFLGVCLAFAWNAGRGFTTAGHDAAGLRMSHAQRWAFFAGAALLALCLAFIAEDSAFTYRGGLLLASAATVAVIFSQLRTPGAEAASAPPTPLQPLLESAPVKWIGYRSYGLYLWHWPILKIVNDLLPQAPLSGGWWAVQALALALVFALAEASYRYVETPIRSLGFRGAWARLQERGRSALLPLAAAAAVLALLAATGVATAPVKSSVQTAVEDNQKLIAAAQARAKERAAAQKKASEAAKKKAPTSGAASPKVPNSPPSTSAAAGTPATAPAKKPDGSLAYGYPADSAMLFIGDSLISTSVVGLMDRFPNANIDGVPNRQWSVAEGLVKQHKADGTLPYAVVIHFGTNGGIPDASVVNRVLDLIGKDHAVVLMSLYGQSTFIDPANALLRSIAAERPNVVVSSWHEKVAANPALVQSDGTHPSMDGNFAYADTVKEAFAELAKKSGAL